PLSTLFPYTTLFRSADRDGFVGIHVGARLLLERGRDGAAHGRHPRHAADEDDVVDLLLLELRVLQALLADRDRLLDEILHQPFRSEEHTSELQSLAY